MTEAQKCLYHIAENMRMDKSISKEGYEYFQQAIKALEQEPCEDCVSRQTLDEIKELMTDINGDTVYAVRMSDLRQLPPVTPQQKIGQWMLSGGYWRCSECKEKVLLKLDKAKGNCKEYMPIKTNYCPNCGTKMEEEEC